MSALQTVYTACASIRGRVTALRRAPRFDSQAQAELYLRSRYPQHVAEGRGYLRVKAPRKAAVLVAVAAGLMSGCTALRDPGEQAWLALHAVDTAQTFRIAGDPACYRESGQAWLIGDHPSEGAVAAWSVGAAGLHLAVTDYLLRTERPKWARAWQAVTIGMTGAAIVENYSIGIRVGGPNKPAHACRE
jgi:hypothetical protein